MDRYLRERMHEDARLIGEHFDTRDERLALVAHRPHESPAHTVYARTDGSPVKVIML